MGSVVEGGSVTAGGRWGGGGKYFCTFTVVVCLTTNLRDRERECMCVCDEPHYLKLHQERQDVILMSVPCVSAKHSIEK